jgi:hypothetical protein
MPLNRTNYGLGVFGICFSGEAGFFVGLETPKLMRKNRNPLRRESRRLIEVPEYTIAQRQGTRDRENKGTKKRAPRSRIKTPQERQAQ